MSVSDDETRETIRAVYLRNAYVLDPHGAVGYAALRRYLNENPGRKGIFLETAHPAKFDSVGEIIGEKVLPPESNVNPARKTRIENDYERVRELIVEIG
jgi:threonine synthase